MTGLLTVPAFASPGVNGGPPGCALSALSGSPDGTWLAFREIGPGTVYVLPITTLLAQLAQQPVPGMVSVNVAHAIVVGQTPYVSPPAWSGQGVTRAVTFASRSLYVIKVILATQEAVTLLRVQQGELTAEAWTLNGKQLVFAQGQPPCLECQPSFTPSHLYLYTPSA